MCVRGTTIRPVHAGFEFIDLGFACRTVLIPILFGNAHEISGYTFPDRMRNARPHLRSLFRAKRSFGCVLTGFRIFVNEFVTGLYGLKDAPAARYIVEKMIVESLFLPKF